MRPLEFNWDAIASLNASSYDCIAQEWMELQHPIQHEDSNFLVKCIQPNIENALVLDFGCGTGHPYLRTLIDQGAQVFGVDQSKEMIRRAKKRFPEANFYIDCMLKFHTIHKFDFVIAWDSIFHIPRGLHPALFNRIREMLNVDGKFIATFGGSDTPPFTRLMMNHMFFFDSWSAEATKNLIQRSGFTIEKVAYLERPDGLRNKGRIAIVACAT
jgi:SAM-dependent methyltransferase